MTAEAGNESIYSIVAIEELTNHDKESFGQTSASELAEISVFV